MRSRETLAGLCLPLIAAVACTQDFSAFEFRSQTDPTETRNDPVTTASAGETDGGRNQETADNAPFGAWDAAVSDRPDAAPSVSTTQDSGVALPPSPCVAAWDKSLASTATCRDCACDACAGPVLDCLNTGDDEERDLCRRVLSCALAHSCQEFRCYCATSECGRPGASGDGPCATAIDSATGGQRRTVRELRFAPPDLDRPYTRAAVAIGCLFGTHPDTPAPAQQEQCAAHCGEPNDPPRTPSDGRRR